MANDPYKSAWRCGPLPYEKYRVLVRDIGTMWCPPCMQKRLHPSAQEIRYLPTRCRRCRQLRARFRQEIAEPMSKMSHSDLTLEALGGDPMRKRLATELLKMYAP